MHCKCPCRRQNASEGVGWRQKASGCCLSISSSCTCEIYFVSLLHLLPRYLNNGIKKPLKPLIFWFIAELDIKQAQTTPIYFIFISSRDKGTLHDTVPPSVGQSVGRSVDSKSIFCRPFYQLGATYVVYATLFRSVFTTLNREYAILIAYKRLR